jgi:formylglycine-generating enzyme required for sulfatase activity
MLTGPVIALPTIAVLVWAVLVWRGVRQVEAKMAFVSIPAGCFQMGSPDSEAGRETVEGPVHRVCLKPFDLGRAEVTQADWRRVMVGIHGFPNNPTPSYFKGDDRLPVESISWDEAQTFIRLMSFFGRRRYRLPSESEYEYAARAGKTRSRYWGENIDDGCAYENIGDQSLKKVSPDDVVANCDDSYPDTAPVGSFKPNPWGLYDMLGNVLTWAQDCYGDYREAPTDGSPNTARPCTYRVVRGGSWSSDPTPLSRRKETKIQGATVLASRKPTTL